MRKIIVVIQILLICLTVIAFSQESTINFHGVLRNSSGRIMPSDNYQLTFRIYNEQGSELWSSTHYEVLVKNGVFNVELGSEMDLNIPFDEPYWVGVSVNGGSELEPRTRLNAAPYALALKGNDNIFPGSGNVGIGTTEPEKQLTVEGNVEIVGDVTVESADIQKISGNLEIENRLELGKGVIQQGGNTPLIGTEDLGLYNMTNNDAISFVSNNGDIRFINDPGSNNIGVDSENFEVVSDDGTLEIDDNPLIKLKEYDLLISEETETINTEIDTDDWVAVIGGFDYGICDLEEDDPEGSWRVQCIESGGTDETWQIKLEGHTHNSPPNWEIDIMFIRRELVDDQR